MIHPAPPSQFHEALRREHDADVEYLGWLGIELTTQSGEVEFYGTTARLEGSLFYASLSGLFLPAGAYGFSLPQFLGEGAITYAPGYAALTRGFSEERAAYLSALEARLGGQIARLQELREGLDTENATSAKAAYWQDYTIGELRHVFREVTTHEAALRDITTLRDVYALYPDRVAEATSIIAQNPLLRDLVRGAAYLYDKPNVAKPELTEELVAKFFEGFTQRGFYDLEQESIQVFLLRIRDAYGITLPFHDAAGVLLGTQPIETLGLDRSDALGDSIANVRQRLQAIAADYLKPLGIAYDRAAEIAQASPEELLSVHLPEIERLLSAGLAVTDFSAVPTDALRAHLDARLEILEREHAAVTLHPQTLTNDDLTELFSPQYDAWVFARIYGEQNSPGEKLKNILSAHGWPIQAFLPAIETAALNFADYKQRDHGGKLRDENVSREIVKQALIEKNAFSAELWEQLQAPLLEYIQLRSRTPQEWLLDNVVARAAAEGIEVEISKEGGSIADWEISILYREKAINGPEDLVRVREILEETKQDLFPGLTVRLGTTESYPTISEHVTTGLLSKLISEIPELSSYIRIAETQYLLDDEGKPRSLFAFANLESDLDRYGGPAAPKHAFSVHGGSIWETRYLDRTRNTNRVRLLDEEKGLIILENRAPGMVDPYLASDMSLKPIKHGFHVYIADAVWRELGGHEESVLHTLGSPEAFKQVLASANDPLLKHLLGLPDEALGKIIEDVKAKLELEHIVPGKYEAIIDAFGEQPHIEDGVGKLRGIRHPLLAYAEPDDIRRVVAEVNREVPNSEGTTNAAGKIIDLEFYVRKLTVLRDRLTGILPNLHDCQFEAVKAGFQNDEVLAIDTENTAILRASVATLGQDNGRQHVA